MHHVRTKVAGNAARAAWLLRTALALGGAALVCGCNTDRPITGAPDVAYDYRLRHPISITEKDQALRVFVGVNRGTLTPAQRAEVLAFAQSWRDEATGGVVIDVPVGTANEASSAAATHEIESIVAASGVPPASIVVRSYRVTLRTLAPVRISYPRMAAQAGPCGIWPNDIGPTMNRDFFENQPVWNAGCATQHNLAAMVDNPADLVQPRGETAASAARRTVVLEKFRQGQDPSTQASSGAGAAKISDVGK